ncbi:MAG: hypothetical protein RJA98_2067 [Pseudomonadota bacterium]|jgi:molybdate-binding protein
MTPLTENGLTLWFLDPDDAAISKYARSQPNDVRWIRAGVLSGFISLPKVAAKIASTTFLDAEEEATVRTHVAADLAWFNTVKSGRAAAG